MFVFPTKIVIHAYEYSINVGTVLFSPSDRRKTHWSKTELGLIRARRYFQELLPPPSFIDTSNEDYIHTLLKYFKDTYATIKREAECPVSDNLMTTAFSDALGGYLKLWVLPISKLSFYGGTVSQDNIVKLYNFHNEIKRYMGTDGVGWRSPDKILLKSITINIAPPRHITRSMKNACQHLAYYEKTDHGLSIPTPHIDWEDDSHTMFVPLRNQSLIPLDSPNYPNTLFKYYDAAKNCIDESNNADQAEFDDRFQSWLSSDVVPHLSDENVYLPLGSVLTLVNKSRALCDRVLNIYDSKIKPTNRHYVLFGFPIDFTSKKTWIIGLILFLEIAWCIPALIYLAFARKKKKKQQNNIYTLLDACRNKAKRTKNDNVFQGISYKMKHQNQGFKIENRPRSENLELESHFIPSDSRGSIATDTRSYFGSNACSAVSVIHETRPPPLKSSLKKIRSSHTAPIQQTVSMKQSRSDRTCASGKRPCNCKKCTPQQSATTNSYSTIPTELELEAEVGSEITIVNQENKAPEVCFDKNVAINMDDEAKPDKKCKNVGLRLESGRPYLEIKIDKPQAEISVGIGGIFDPLKGIKRSKIPKRLPKTSTCQMTNTPPSPPRKESPPPKMKSQIPQLKKRPVDDIDVQLRRPSSRRKDSKLNVTL
ncbi:uncharacterized protein LOC114354632 [Ostrinia furnacalis]|uniref:uncharacterized protein LOC114354632 n=1 Tax=Ostrinia furnacalis TaxID=93504 RepID=UPI00103E3F7B|nr:uncharacterized protein LOC114354632 [Ostrinia furnacalis]